MSPAEAKERAEKFLPQVLHDAFAKYLHTFGVEPHGTLPQMAALSELGIISSVAALLLTTHQEGEDKGREEAAKIAEEYFGAWQLVQLGSKSPYTIKQAKDQIEIATAIRKTKSGEGRG